MEYTLKQIGSLALNFRNLAFDIISVDRLQSTLPGFPVYMFTDTHLRNDHYTRAWAEPDRKGTYEICVYNTDSRKKWPTYPATRKPDGLDLIDAIRLLHHWNQQQLSRPDTKKGRPIYISWGTHYKRAAELCDISF